MKRATAFLGIVAAASLLAWLGYLATQQPRVWFNHGQGIAKLILLRGGYRSWGFDYADGEGMVNGKWSTISFIRSNGIPVAVRVGHRWPVFTHSDVRLFLSNNPSLVAP